VNSAAVAASLARGIGADPARCFVIRNGVEAGRVQPRVSRAQARAALGLGAEAPVVAMIAALKPQKRHAMLLHAAARLLERRPATTFLLAGEGRERASIEVLAAALGIGAQVRLLGMRTDVPDVLAAADVSVLTSEHEGTPNAVLESMACGVPVVCTRFEGAEEVVTDGHDGYLVARDDLVGLVERVGHLLDEPAARVRLGEGGRATVRDWYDLDRNTAALADVYRRLGARAVP
jgi:glycosyltransferase involved in cell wall biosynthesis